MIRSDQGGKKTNLSDRRKMITFKAALTGPDYPLDVNGDAQVRGRMGVEAGVYSDPEYSLQVGKSVLIRRGLETMGNVAIGGGIDSSIPLTVYGKERVTGDLIVQGNVGVGTPSPGYMLDVNGEARVNALKLGVSDFRIQTARPDRVDFPTGGGRYQFLALRAYEYSWTTEHERTVLVPARAGFRITDRTGRDTNFEFYNNGDLWILGNYSRSSDSRTKANQEPLNYGLTEVLKLQPKRFIRLDWTRDQETEEIEFDETTAETDFGLIAQEVYELMPEAVKKPVDETTEYWGLDYGKLVAVLAKAIQEQQETIGNQHAEIESLKDRIAALEQK